MAVFTNIPNPYNRHLFRALRDLGWDLRVVYKGNPQSMGRPWNIVPDDGDVIAGSVREEQRELRRCRAEERCVILTGGYLGLIEMQRNFMLSRDRAPVLFWGERLRPSTPIAGLIRRIVFTRFDAVLAIGSWAVSSYRAVAPGVPIHVMPYTTKPLGASESQRASQPTVGFAGSLVHRKGVDRLLRGLASIRAEHRPSLEVVGSGQLRDDLRILGRRLGLSVQWLGELSSGELDQARSRWWVQAVPSRYDGWGVVVAEAMAAGLPVVASSTVGAAMDLVRPGFNGAIVTDNHDWHSALLRYTNPAVVAREGHRARLTSEAFSAKAAAAWLGRLLDRGVDVGGESQSFIEEAWATIEARHQEGGGEDLGTA